MVNRIAPSFTCSPSLLQEVRPPRDPFGGFDGGGVIGSFEIARDLLLQRECDRHFRRRRRYVAVALVAGRKHRGQGGRGSATRKPPGPTYLGTERHRENLKSHWSRTLATITNGRRNAAAGPS